MPDRRHVLKLLSAAGVTSAVFGRAILASGAGKDRITESMIRRAEWIAGIGLDDGQRKMLVSGLNEADGAYAAMRAVPLDNAVPPAIRFDPRPGELAAPDAGAFDAGAPWSPDARRRPASDAEIAFAPVTDLAGMIRSGVVSSVELTRLYLDRLRRFDPELLCVVTMTEELAMRQAERADQELGSGRPRGPLHGIPWAAKDLFSVPGYPTTWGSVPYRDQVRAETAAAVSRLEAAGAVLVAKTAVGELAMGDVWFGGMTRNPWKPDQGSSGSSAGSASAVAAGLVGFALGTETLGSIVSPCTRCGASGLRPTFGRVSRHGVMALSWTMDKVGPIARSVDDLALVFDAIRGADPRDPATVERPFSWFPSRDPRSIRVGFVPALFDADYTKWAETGEDTTGYEDWQRNDRAVLDALRGLGFRLVPLDLTTKIPVDALVVMLTAEAAAAFDDLTRSGRDAEMVRQTPDAWPNVFRAAQWIPAVEYLRAARLRTLLMREMETVLGDVDVYVAPTYGGDNLTRTNLTGHPAVCVPNGFRTTDGTPTSITFQGRPFGEDDLLAVARAYQEATGFHRKRPPLSS